jgi:hypothetical protein
MDDGIVAGKCGERLRPQQAMSIGNYANGSHHALVGSAALIRDQPRRIAAKIAKFRELLRKARESIYRQEHAKISKWRRD